MSYKLNKEEIINGAIISMYKFTYTHSTSGTIRVV